MRGRQVHESLKEPGTVAEVAARLGVKLHVVDNALRPLIRRRLVEPRGRRRDHVKGFAAIVWAAVGEWSPSPSSRYLNPIRDQNGVIYKGVNDAAARLRIPQPSISQVLAGKRQTASGFVFERASLNEREHERARRLIAHLSVVASSVELCARAIEVWYPVALKLVRKLHDLEIVMYVPGSRSHPSRVTLTPEAHERLTALPTTPNPRRGRKPLDVQPGVLCWPKKCYTCGASGEHQCCPVCKIRADGHNLVERIFGFRLKQEGLKKVLRLQARCHRCRRSMPEQSASPTN